MNFGLFGRSESEIFCAREERIVLLAKGEGPCIVMIEPHLNESPWISSLFPVAIVMVMFYYRYYCGRV